MDRTARPPPGLQPYPSVPYDENASGCGRATSRPFFLADLRHKPNRTKLPRPFGKGCIVWDGPHVCPPDASDEDVERLSVEWAAAMTAACARAEAALAA